MRILNLRRIISVGLIASCLLASGPAYSADTVFSDSMSLVNDRQAGQDLMGVVLEKGKAKWVVDGSVVFHEDGSVTSANSAGGTGFHPIPHGTGIYRLSAEVNPSSTSCTTIAFSNKYPGGNFFATAELSLILAPNGSYEISARGVGKIRTGTKADYPDFNPEGFTGLEMEFNSLKNTLTVRINGGKIMDRQELRTRKIGPFFSYASFRFNGTLKPEVPRLKNYSMSFVPQVTSGLVPDDASEFFVEPGQDFKIHFKADSVVAGVPVPYVITDYNDEKVLGGNAEITGEARMALASKLPRGYYEIIFPSSEERFGLVVLEKAVQPDPFFCMDSGLSWLERNPGKRTALVKILSRCGIAMSRERLSHGSVNPEKDKWDWEGGERANESMRRTYIDSKVSILEIISGGGKHMETMKTPPYFPQNMVEASLAWTDLARHWQGSWGGVEVFNEPDLALIPADQYSTLVKTASFAMSQAETKVPLISGVFATIPPSPFFDTYSANGILDDTDAVSLHSYDKAPDVEGMFVRYRSWLKSLGKESMPLWHTECGWSWKNGPGRPPMDQDAASALEITAKSIETKVCGAVRHFPFVYVYYEEGAKNFGMMGREVTPLRSMAGYAVCAKFLSGKDYLGDLSGIDKSVKLARVFGDRNSGECTVALYTGELDKKALVALPFQAGKVSGIDGRDLKAADGKIPVPDGMAYVWTDLASIGTALKTDTAAAKLYSIGKQPLEQKRVSSPIVLQFLNAQTPLRMSASKYLITQEISKILQLNIRIHNLSKTEIKLVPALQLPSGGKDESLAQITVPALGKVDVAWQVDASKNLDISDTRLIKVTAKTETEIQPAPLAIPMVMEGTLEEHLKRHGSQKLLPVTDLDLWKENIAGHGKSKFSAENSIWKMDVAFSATVGSWAYPVFTLQNPIDPSVDSGFLIRARIPKSANNVALMANPNQPDGFWMSDLFPADGEWHVVYVPFGEMKPGPGHAGMQNTRLNAATWKKIAVGMGTRVKENSLEISHLIIVGK
ncbi:MAG TPA: hypothetical protein DET40_06760 [Lentisphaeria bacterium]|nr:MAG: hypothetical protein A2X45_07540 [Lentisphaerae bacterium GWF2_50_93]HCE43230.1 hypothetical protein [Lentisphaeria bacterium]